MDLPPPKGQKRRGQSSPRVAKPRKPDPIPEDLPPVLIPEPVEAGPAAQNRARLRELLGEIARRRQAALFLFEPLPAQEAFFASQAGERLLRGGKTLPAAVEVARAVTGQDPHNKYPLRDGVAIGVGWDLQHRADVMWKKLSRAGQFKMIRDPETNEWRAFRPGEKWDAEHEYLVPPQVFIFG